MLLLSDKIKDWFIHEKNIEKSTFVWNTVASFLNSFQTMLLLLVITRTGSANDSSIFVMAYSIGNLLYNISKYGIRQYQVTDIEEKFSFDEYKKERKFSSFLMFLSVVAYLINNYTMNGYSEKKCIVVFLICLYKGIEAYEDVLHGRMQQKGRLDIAGKILAIRLFTFIVGFIVIYALTGKLILTTTINVVVTFLLCIILNNSVIGNFENKSSTTQTANWKKLLIECFPLCVSMILNMYLGNAPKYIIDEVVSDEIQTNFNIVFMPVFVVSLLSMFIFQPNLLKIGILWEKKDKKGLTKLLGRLTAVPIVFDIVITLIGGVLGIPVLSFIYGLDLADYTRELIVFLLAGGAIAILNLYIMVLTTLREQHKILIGYCLAAGIMFFFGRKILFMYGLTVLTIFFFMDLILLDLYCITIVIWRLRKEKMQGQG